MVIGGLRMNGADLRMKFGERMIVTVITFNYEVYIYVYIHVRINSPIVLWPM